MKCSRLIRLSMSALLLQSFYAVGAPAVASQQEQPTHTAKGALTMYGHEKRLKNRQDREEKQRNDHAHGHKNVVYVRPGGIVNPFAVTTANILGRFDGPFEFDGDYGQENNETREKVFDLLVSKEALARNLPKEELNAMMATSTITPELFIAESIKTDKDHGPTLKEVVTPEIMKILEEKQKTLKQFTKEDIQAIQKFVAHYGNQKIFYFLRNIPPAMLKLEQNLKDLVANLGTSIDLPIIDSTTLLKGTTGFELKKNLANALFTDAIMNAASTTLVDKKDGGKVKPITVQIDDLKPDFLRTVLGSGDNKDLYALCTKAGLVFFYWLYQAVNLDLIAQASLIDEVNDVKKNFILSLGDSHKRAVAFRKKLIDTNTKALFLQEADKKTRDVLTHDGLFLGTGKQNTQDGTVVLLASDFWEPAYEVIPLPQYARYKNGALTAILARKKDTRQLFLLASGHGHSTEAEDGREQIRLISQTLNNLMQEKGEEIFLIIGTDANTKKKDDVHAFQHLLHKLNLASTHVGPTTIKKRMVTVQHGKAGLYAVDEEDYIIVMKDQLILNQVTVGFGQPGKKADPAISLPNLGNQSDHYPVSAVVQSAKAITIQEGPTAIIAKENGAQSKPRSSALKKEALVQKAKKSVSWADDAGGKLKEVQELGDDLDEATIKKKAHRRIGG